MMTTSYLVLMLSIVDMSMILLGRSLHMYDVAIRIIINVGKNISNFRQHKRGESSLTEIDLEFIQYSKGYPH